MTGPKNAQTGERLKGYHPVHSLLIPDTFKFLRVCILSPQYSQDGESALKLVVIKSKNFPLTFSLVLAWGL